MSHRPQRKEKNCLNCGATVAGKFCQVCGQENAEPKDTVLGLLQHFLYDITHFDGMFFRSLKMLLFKPGMLTKKYIEGKRASYLNPIKMYVFTSAIFFIIFFTFLNPVKNLYDDSAEAKISGLEKVKHDLVTVRDSSEKSVNLDAMNSAIRETDSNIAALGRKAEEEKKSMTNLKKSIGDSVLIRKQNFGITIDSGDLRSKATGGNGFMEGLSFSNVDAYQVYQKHLPDSLKDKMIKKAVLYRFIKMKEQGSEDRLEPVRALMERFIHAFPQLLFISLPIFAMILNMLYFRRKQYLYVDHIIFTLHLFCATFIFILFIALFSKWGELTGLKIFNGISSLIVLVAFFYEYKALRNFYGQGRLKTIIKFYLLNMLAGIALSLLIAALIIISAFQI